MKKTFIFLMALMFIMSMLLSSCTEKNNNADNTMKEDLNSSIDIADSDDEIEVIKIPVLVTDAGIVAEMGYNDEDGRFVLLTRENSYGQQDIYRGFDEIPDDIEIGKSLNRGDILGYWYGSESDITTNNDLNTDDFSWDDYFADDFQNIYPWKGYDEGNDWVQEFDDGTKIINGALSTTTNIGQNAVFYFQEKGVIHLTNGIKIDVPVETILNYIFEKNTFVRDNILIGDGDATITQSDGTYLIVPKGTIVDYEGNVG